MFQMRSVLALSLLFTVACGPLGPGDPDFPGTASCATSGCSPGFQCLASQCSLNPSSMWRLTVTSGMMANQNASGSSWDNFGGAPDPLVCLTISGVRSCTTTKQDTLIPVWNEASMLVPATALQAGITTEILDEDPFSFEKMCTVGVIPVIEANFLTGVWGAGCPVASFDATLTAQ